MFGWSGRILRINLSKGEAYDEPIGEYKGSFIGGRGINVKIAYNEIDPSISAFDPANNAPCYKTRNLLNHNTPIIAFNKSNVIFINKSCLRTSGVEELAGKVFYRTNLTINRKPLHMTVKK